MNLAGLLIAVGVIALANPAASFSEEAEQLEKRIFKLPLPHSSPNRGEGTPPKELLESIGIEFPEGASAGFDPASGELTVVNTPFSLDLVAQYLSLESNGMQASRQLRILVEHITLPHDRAAALVHEHMGKGEANLLRAELRTMIQSGKAAVTASNLVTTRNGQRAKVESTMEKIYPVEFDPGEVPEAVTGKLNGNPNFVVPVRGTAFDTRNTGLTLEVDPVIGAGGSLIDLNVAPEMVELLGLSSYGTGLSRVVQPDFYTQKVGTAVSITDGSYQLLAMHTPAPEDRTRANYENAERTLVFVRPLTQTRKAEKEERLGFSGAYQLSFLLEYIEVGRNDAAALCSMKTEALDDSTVRQRALKLITDGTAKRLETSYLVTRSGQRAKSESVLEVHYPASAGPPQIPAEARAGSGAENLVIPLSVSNFKIRHTGTILELDPVLGADGHTIDIQIRPSIVELLGRDAYGLDESELEQPVFGSMEVFTSTRLIDRRPVLLGVHVPLDRETGERKADRSVLLFLTGAVQEVEP